MATRMKPRNCRKHVPKSAIREQLFNAGKVGPIKQIQVSTERIVKVRGILFDIDPQLYRHGGLIQSVNNDPHIFYRDTVKFWLRNHPILDKAEVRVTGTGLHIIPRFAEPVVIEDENDRERWAAIIQVVQAALPVDHHAPGITATTRALGSLNEKNGAKVVRLRKGRPVQIAEILDLYQAMCDTPFKTVMTILTGTEQLAPCPFCQDSASSLVALNHVGQCYHCGRINLDRLYNLVFSPCEPATKKERRRAK